MPRKSQVLAGAIKPSPLSASKVLDVIQEAIRKYTETLGDEGEIEKVVFNLLNRRVDEIVYLALGIKKSGYSDTLEIVKPSKLQELIEGRAKAAADKFMVDAADRIEAAFILTKAAEAAATRNAAHTYEEEVRHRIWEYMKSKAGLQPQ